MILWIGGFSIEEARDAGWVGQETQPGILHASVDYYMMYVHVYVCARMYFMNVCKYAM
jgi:hypothetical protein